MKFVGLMALATTFALSGPTLAETAQVKRASFEIIGSMNDNDDFAVLNNNQNYATDEGIGERQTVAFQRDLAPGSILIKTRERKLYFVLPGGKAYQYPVGVGRQGFTWSGRNHVSRKAEWPDWRPPPVMIAREAKKGRDLPEIMEGGPDNPLGARALYIGSTEYRIHGTTQPWSIGRAVSSGCIRMLNEHVIDLYDHVRIGATVVVES